MSRKSYVYLITNTTNGMQYVGKSVDPRSRWKYHRCAARRGSPLYLHRAMRSHGAECFDFRVVAEYDSDAAALDSERLMIAELNTKNRDIGYNLSDGGEVGPTGFSHTVEAREKIRTAGIGRIITEEQRLERSRRMLGTKRGPLSAAHKAKISAVHKGRVHSEESRVKRRAVMLGRKHTPETIAKVRESRRGFRHTEEHKARLSAMLKGKTYTPAQIEKYRVAAQRREDRNRCARWFVGVMSGAISYET